MRKYGTECEWYNDLTNKELWPRGGDPKERVISIPYGMGTKWRAVGLISSFTFVNDEEKPLGWGIGLLVKGDCSSR